MTTLAYCYGSGQIGFGEKCPGGALPLVRGGDQEVRDFMSGVARHAYDGETLLVPGIPEAENQTIAFQKLIVFLNWIEPAAKRAGLQIMCRHP